MGARRTVVAHAQRHDIRPAALPAGNLARQFGKDIEFEGGAGGELCVGVDCVQRCNPIVLQFLNDETARSRKRAKICFDFVDAVAFDCKAFGE